MSATAGSVRTGTRHDTASDTRSASSPGRSSVSASAISAGHPGAARRPNTSSSRSESPTVRDVTCPMPYRRWLFLCAWPSAEADRGTPLDQQARERSMTYVVRSRPVVLRPDRRRPNPVVEQVRLELIDDARTDLPQLEVPAAAEQVSISDG